MSRLSNTRIVEAMHAGLIRIEPFDPGALNTVSYDLTLAGWVGRFRRRLSGNLRVLRLAIDDPAERYTWEFHSSDAAAREEAEALWFTAAEEFDLEAIQFRIFDDDEISWAAGEILLSRTREICGGLQTITADLGAPSTVGRHAMTACRCAGIGDVGYAFHPWTLEMMNDTYDPVALPVGAVVAQATFEDVGPILPGTSYEQRGSYGGTALPWHPLRNMMPKRIKVRP